MAKTIPTLPAEIDGVAITSKYDAKTGVTTITGTRSVGEAKHTATMTCDDGDAYPEQALLNVAWAVAKRVNNAVADGGPPKVKA